MKRYWCSWVCEEDDHRPLTYPPNEGILGWWCSGYTPEDHATLCALVEAESVDHVREVVLKDWPEFVKDWPSFGGQLWRIEPEEVASDWLPIDRFPLSDWMKERIEGI